MNYLEQNSQSHRVILPDLVRAFALFGIAVVNVAYFANPMGDYHSGGGMTTAFDRGSYMAVNGLFAFKSYTLFSFMFGVGFAYQMSSAKRQSASFDTRYWRRIMGLFMFGFINVAFLFQGDILAIYGLLGALLYAFKDAAQKTLHRWAIGFYAVQLTFMGMIALVLWLGETYAPEDMAEAFSEADVQIAAAKEVFSNGSFLATIDQRLTEWGQVFIMGTLMQGWGVLAFFLLGLSAVKSGVIHQASHPIWRKFRLFCLPIGLAGSFFGGWMMANATSMWSAYSMTGMFFITLFAPFSTAGYLGLIAWWAQSDKGWLKTFLARGGTSSLTAYLMQGLILSVIFNGYGFGLYAKLGAGWCIAIAAATALFTIAFASIWRLKYQRGPLEILLRRWTYMKG